jgi:hypothetical protein
MLHRTVVRGDDYYDDDDACAREARISPARVHAVRAPPSPARMADVGARFAYSWRGALQLARRYALLPADAQGRPNDGSVVDYNGIPPRYLVYVEESNTDLKAAAWRLLWPGVALDAKDARSVLGNHGTVALEFAIYEAVNRVLQQREAALPRGIAVMSRAAFVGWLPVRRRTLAPRELFGELAPRTDSVLVMRTTPSSGDGMLRAVLRRSQDGALFQLRRRDDAAATTVWQLYCELVRAVRAGTPLYWLPLAPVPAASRWWLPDGAYELADDVDADGTVFRPLRRDPLT